MGAFEDHYRFYHEFHQERRNQIVHMLFVPLILWSVLIFLREWSLDLVLMVTYAVYYLIIDMKFGILSLPYLSFLLVLERLFYNYVGQSIAIRVALFCQVVSWLAQFAAHEFFEGRRPALLSSLAQALGMAPLFVYIEILMLLGLFKDKMQGIQEMQAETKR
ncbi:hypothetical protein NDN08_004592 [Rhodosorus marinus]|uniref:DUF962 domain-containing protein n=1 Tax=Rhodosorus marinus TaxID=101924 RepID=A0AAV8ULR6_9RHOD|nr:hypothetical protein NDN08_004592 [Rhodosorus marinus]